MKPTAETTAPGLAGRENDLKFGLTFTIINRDFTAALNDQNSPEYKSLVAELTAMVRTNFLLEIIDHMMRCMNYF